MLQQKTENLPGTHDERQASVETSSASLIFLGLTVILLSLHQAGYFPFSMAALGTALFYGALAQIASGLLAWRRQDAFGTVLGTAFGLFWFSLIALLVLPETGIGRTPQPAALSSYFVFWGLFTMILCSGAGRFSRELQVFLAMVCIFLMLLAAAVFSPHPWLNALAGTEGIACGLTGIYTGLTHLMSSEVERTMAHPKRHRPA